MISGQPLATNLYISLNVILTSSTSHKDPEVGVTSAEDEMRACNTQLENLSSLVLERREVSQQSGHMRA